MITDLLPSLIIQLEFFKCIDFSRREQREEKRKEMGSAKKRTYENGLEKETKKE